MGDAAACDVVVLPVLLLQGVDAHARSRLGAVYETPLPEVDARVVSRPRGLEDHDVARAEGRTFDALSSFCLVARHAGHVHAVLRAGPVHEAGAVESAPGGYASPDVGLAQLTAGRGGYGGPGSRGMADIAGAGMVFAACRKEHEGKGEQGVQEKAGQSEGRARFFHGRDYTRSGREGTACYSTGQGVSRYGT